MSVREGGGSEETVGIRAAAGWERTSGVGSAVGGEERGILEEDPGVGDEGEAGSESKSNGEEGETTSR